jgi:hypothetical protein
MTEHIKTALDLNTMKIKPVIAEVVKKFPTGTYSGDIKTLMFETVVTSKP